MSGHFKTDRGYYAINLPAIFNQIPCFEGFTTRLPHMAGDSRR